MLGLQDDSLLLNVYQGNTVQASTSLSSVWENCWVCWQMPCFSQHWGSDSRKIKSSRSAHTMGDFFSSQIRTRTGALAHAPPHTHTYTPTKTGHKRLPPGCWCVKIKHWKRSDPAPSLLSPPFLIRTTGEGDICHLFNQEPFISGTTKVQLASGFL